MKAVMYHYVRGETDRAPEYYYLDIDDFRKQLDHFEEEFGFVRFDDFLATVRGDTESIPSGVVLTFDDGLRDHYEFVFPELCRRGLWGIFYVPSGPYVSGRLLDVHRTHVLLGEVRGSRLLSHVTDVVDGGMVPHSRREEFRTETYRHHDDSEATKRVKRILNYYIADEHRSAVLERLVERTDLRDFDSTEYYMRPEELREMHDSGMIIGAHTVNHPVLSLLDQGNQRAEIEDSFAFLEGIVDGLEALTFCYPYGGEYTYTDATVSILEQAGCEWCFTVAAADITRRDVEESVQALPRYDCNEFPHGKVSGSI